MRMLNRLSPPALLGATLLAFTGSVIAVEATTGAPPPPQAAMPAETPTPAERFEALDADADGSISRAEAEASPALRERFDAADTDRSGGLSEAEYLALVSGGTPMPKSPAEG